MIMGVTEFVLFIATIVLFASLVSYGLTLRVKITRLSNLLAQEVVDKISISNKLAAMVSEKNSDTLQQSDGFIKFLSESRDSAFKYIEDVQKELDTFIKDVGPVVNAYREVSTEDAGSQKIIEAYDNLAKFLPEESSKN